jgi:sugar lactone lactonase YvrE
LHTPTQVTVDTAGNVLIADLENNRIRRVNRKGIINTVAGTGAYSFSGDGGFATTADLASPWGVGVDRTGKIYIADTSNYRVREVSAVSKAN